MLRSDFIAAVTTIAGILFKPSRQQTYCTASLALPREHSTKIIHIPLPERLLFSTFIFTDSTSQGSKDDKTMVRPGFEPETSRVHFKCETDVITNYTIEPLFKVETFYIPSRY